MELSCNHKSNCVFPAVTIFVCCATSTLLIEIFHQGLKIMLAGSSCSNMTFLAYYLWKFNSFDVTLGSVKLRFLSIFSDLMI